MRHQKTPDSRVIKLEKKIQILEKEVEELFKSQSIIENDLQNESEKCKPRDAIWGCKKCGSRLGIYDPDTDELRIRYKDLFVYVQAGEGGYVKIVCRSCSFLNKVSYSDK